MYYKYGKDEIEYLKSKDSVLSGAIIKIGHIYREVNEDIFSSIIYHVIGQQISIAAQRTIWKRMTLSYGKIRPENVAGTNIDMLQKFGITFRKAGYIKSIAEKAVSGEFNYNELIGLNDDEAIDLLKGLPGIGLWTAQMVLIFCLQRPDIFSYGDLAIRRGLSRLYRHESIDRKLFDYYKRLYSPCGSVASLYIWAVSADKEWN